MPRPSRNIDKLLIKTGIEMLPEFGISGLSIRDVVQRADVNLGMFHYHFKTKEAFARMLLEEVYEQMFSRLTHSLDEKASGIANLQSALGTLGRFARDQHRILLSIVMDMKQGNEVATAFAKANFPRHLRIILSLVEKAQAEGDVIRLPPPQILVFLASSIAVPALLGGVMLNPAFSEGPALGTIVENFIMSDAAIDQRVRMALKGISS